MDQADSLVSPLWATFLAALTTLGENTRFITSSAGIAAIFLAAFVGSAGLPFFVKEPSYAA